MMDAVSYRLLTNTSSCRLILLLLPDSAYLFSEVCFRCPNCISVLLYVCHPRFCFCSSCSAMGVKVVGKMHERLCAYVLRIFSLTAVLTNRFFLSSALFPNIFSPFVFCNCPSIIYVCVFFIFRFFLLCYILNSPV